MTVLVGIRCLDGVVIASDSAATFGSNGSMTIGQQEVQKVSIIADSIAYAGTGAVGISQLIINTIGKRWVAKSFSGVRNPDDMMNEIGKAIGELVAPYWQTAQIQRHLTGDASASLCKSLISVPVNKRFELFQFDFNGAPERATDRLPFVALGSGQVIADPFLALLKRLLWPDTEPTLAEGRLVAVWVIDHVRRTNPGGVGGPIQLAVLTNEGQNVEILAADRVNEHMQAVDAVLDAIVRQIRGNGASAAAAPPVPAFQAG